MCDAERQLAKARHLLELMRGDGVYDIPKLRQALTQQPCQHQDRSE